ncbi:hypothetical protein GCM10010080_24910 [Thermomonas carbonis]|uniref:Nmad3 family putative nucleotide modification protein n=1 Tax=Thermomonas carbonis TaxID=1463158 RepID=UPI001672A47D|nr:hypothetical protein [Thermomonas carbonis]GHC08873.1 hypothetical protein GCM10010080_24910 [Thermomonas carbonis]
MAPESASPDTRIYRYVVAYDGGTAPRPYDGLCSLAICKPKIRASAQVGDWIVGFRSKHPGEVLYAMQVSERLTLSEYWEDPRFAARKPGHASPPDNIYKPDPYGGLQQVPNVVHTPDNAQRDISGRYVLLSERFWYFGANSVPLPNELLHLVHTTQGHAIHVNRKKDDVRKLVGWLRSWPTGRHGMPIDAKVIAPAVSVAEPGSTSAKHQKAKVDRPMPSCSPQRRSPTHLHPAESSGFDGRIIFSRKGFDSQYGGMPSPILPDGRLLPLPIPSSHDVFRMQDLAVDGVDLGALISDLSQGRHSLATTIHLDPDLNRRPDLQLPGWRPSLGQTGAAQSHLASQKVGVGDVFLFFGWFRQVENVQGQWRYARNAPHLHVLFGWLEVGDVLAVVIDRDRAMHQYPWIGNHPHVASPAHYTHRANTLYIASERSRFVPQISGGGLFPHLRDPLRLTAPGKSRSAWQLPRWFYPTTNRQALSYHQRLDRWSLGADNCELQSVAKGQEFVLPAEQYPESEEWLRGILAHHTVRAP